MGHNATYSRTGKWQVVDQNVLRTFSNVLATSGLTPALGCHRALSKCSEPHSKVVKKRDRQRVFLFIPIVPSTWSRWKTIEKWFTNRGYDQSIDQFQSTDHKLCENQCGTALKGKHPGIIMQVGCGPLLTCSHSKSIVMWLPLWLTHSAIKIFVSIYRFKYMQLSQVTRHNVILYKPFTSQWIFSYSLK